MIAYIRSHLGAKVFVSYMAIIILVLLILTAAGQFALPSSFDRHMLRMMSPQAMIPGHQGWGMMGSPTADTREFRMQLFADYRAGFNDAFLAAGATALLAAVLLSLVLSSNMTRSIRAMSEAAERIAAGQYEERVAVTGRDELSQLASRFNEMAQKLDEIESMRRRLIADVSHELRTPLTAIQGSMEGLIDGLLPGSRETYEQVHAEAQRLDRLVNDLQELSRVEAHALQLQHQSVGISSLVRTVFNRLTPEAEAKGIELTAEQLEEAQEVIGDQDRLLQVISNLLSNALLYTPRGGRITVSARRTPNEIQISVRDTGCGIASQDLPRVFDRFYRVDRSRSRQAGGGSGIGLTIARALVEAHGGRIWAESEGEGKGSTFTFALPTVHARLGS